jgi:ribosomal protein L7/L12
MEIQKSIALGYWVPWSDKGNLVDSYRQYVKDASLVKYGADTIGQYINQASYEQVNAINELGQKIGRGLNILSNQMSQVNENLVFLNKNLDIQIEQQKLSNLLLQNIVDLLRLPDSEKERRHSIELGIKFFIKAQNDEDLYADALEELLKAESLMKQDYFVLHRIGCIYLYVEKFIDPEKALDYFLKAAKYAIVDDNENTDMLYSALVDNKIGLITENNNDITSSNVTLYLKNAGDSKLGVLALIKNLTGLSLIEAKDIVDTVPSIIKEDVAREEAENYKKALENLGAEIEIIGSSNSNDIKSTNIDSQSGNFLAADSFEKAAFASYVIGNVEDAVTYQGKSLKLKYTPENAFMLAKYLVRNGNIEMAINTLDDAINKKPELVLAVFSELDLANSSEILKLVEQKNDEINVKINNFIEKVKSTQSSSIDLDYLNDLLTKSYDLKVNEFNSYDAKLIDINSDLIEQKTLINELINKVKVTHFMTFDDIKCEEIVKELRSALDKDLEQMQVVYEIRKKEIDDDEIKIGCNYRGGIVFYLDTSGKHGLVYADINLGEAIWGGNGKIHTGSEFGLGAENTKKIVELASWGTEGGFFSSKKVPVYTAARICYELNHNGFNDWYLPSKEELNVLISNISKQDLYKVSKNADFWTSTEYKDTSFNYGEKKSIAFNYKYGFGDFDKNSSFKRGFVAIRNF